MPFTGSCCLPPSCTGCVDASGNVVYPPNSFQVVVSGVTYATSCTFLTAFFTGDGSSSYQSGSMKVRQGTCNGTFCVNQQVYMGPGYCRWEATLPNPIIVDLWSQWFTDPSSTTPNCTDTFSGTTPYNTVTLDKLVIEAAAVPSSGSYPGQYEFIPAIGPSFPPTPLAWQFWCNIEKGGSYAQGSNNGWPGGYGIFRALEIVDAVQPNCTRNAIYSNLVDRFGELYPPGYTYFSQHIDYPYFGVGKGGTATIISDGC